VVLIGNGYRKVVNGGTYLNAGVTFTTGSAGSRMLGFYMNGVSIQVNDDNILIANNLVSGNYIGITGSNDTIRNNIIGGSSYGVYLSGGSGHYIANNVFKAISSYGIYSYMPYTNTVLLINNFFDANQYAFAHYQGYMSGFTVTGNILYKGSYVANGTAALLYAGNLHYNMAASYKTASLFPGVLADNTEGDPQFANFSTSSGFVYNDDPGNDTDLRINAASPAVDLGYPSQAPMTATYIDYHPAYTFGGARSDAGVYGGPWTFPYPLGAPPTPSVTSISVSPSVVSPGGTLNLNVTGSVGGFTGRGN
jgi:hypothetical protein